MSLLSKSQACIEMSQGLLYAGDNTGSLECALEAAKYLQLIRLLHQELKGDELRKAARVSEEQWQSEFDHLSNLLDQKDAEIERLKSTNTLLQGECANRGARIADLERLIVGAADALEEIPYSKRLNSQRGLITELRKAV